ncbi:MAG: ABC transporter ATP-binding protein [Opitutaceae bacterium]|nr:ABC transporter ATP-binding protein [Verrucomicrobiales bacterium]
MSAALPLLKLVDVIRTYQTVEGAAPVAILKGITLELTRGESVAIVGPSGSGKSTLLNIMGTLDRPTSGQVWLDGEDLEKLGEEKLATVRNRKIGFIFQAHHLLPQCTVLENVLVPVIPSKVAEEKRLAAIRGKQLLERVGLGERLSHRPGQLSGGERQRVAVVRALINRPGLLLADEPTGALDRVSAGELTQLLLELNREEHVTLVTVTHAPELARQMSRLLTLRDGLLVQES